MAVPGGMLGFGVIVMVTAWILLALWLVHRHRVLVVAISVAGVVAPAVAVLLYWSDVFGTR